MREPSVGNYTCEPLSISFMAARFICKDGMEIPDSAKCNNILDCREGEDEGQAAGCYTSATKGIMFFFFFRYKISYS